MPQPHSLKKAYPPYFARFPSLFLHVKELKITFGRFLRELENPFTSICVCRPSESLSCAPHETVPKTADPGARALHSTGRVSSICLFPIVCSSRPTAALFLFLPLNPECYVSPGDDSGVVTGLLISGGIFVAVVAGAAIIFNIVRRRKQTQRP